MTSERVKSETGYIFDFQGRAFSPDGQVEMTPEQIEAHNSRLMAQELKAMKQTGKALLYLFKGKTGFFNESDCDLSVGAWASKAFQRSLVMRVRHSRNNWGAQRTDVWFNADGSTWHGVNVGDNDIVRCKRTKAH